MLVACALVVRAASKSNGAPAAPASTGFAALPPPAQPATTNVAAKPAAAAPIRELEALSELNTPDKKIITAENPVEYTISGMNQCQINPEAGMTFQKALRAMLRQAPHIILVGEIRDKETSEIAVQAALTRHLVFSTIHTNDAPSALTRLIDIGVVESS